MAKDRDARAASQIGCTVEVYRRERAAGRWWCRLCRRWLPHAEFYAATAHYRLSNARCKTCHRNQSRVAQQRRRANSWERRVGRLAR